MAYILGNLKILANMKKTIKIQVILGWPGIQVMVKAKETTHRKEPIGL